MKRDEIDFLTVYTDGGCKGNGGANPKAYGSFVVHAMKKDGTTVEVKRTTVDFPACNTNNQAEYAALIRALEYLFDLKQKGFVFDTFFKTDSELLVNQMLGLAKVKNTDLMRMHEKAKKVWGEICFTASIEKIDRSKIFEIIGH